jgi:hypothetical protein
MLILFDKWFGLNINIFKEGLTIDLGMFVILYVHLTWNHYNMKLSCGDLLSGKSIYWKWIEIGILY